MDWGGDPYENSVWEQKTKLIDKATLEFINTTIKIVLAVIAFKLMKLGS